MRPALRGVSPPRLKERFWKREKPEEIGEKCFLTLSSRPGNEKQLKILTKLLIKVIKSVR